MDEVSFYDGLGIRSEGRDIEMRGEIDASFESQVVDNITQHVR